MPQRVVKCHRCETTASIALNAIRRRRNTPMSVVVPYLKAVWGTLDKNSQHSSSSRSIRSPTIWSVRLTREDIDLFCKLEAVSSDAARAALSRSFRCSVFRTLAASSSLLVHLQNRGSYLFTIFTLNSFSIAARTERGKRPPRKNPLHTRPLPLRTPKSPSLPLIQKKSWFFFAFNAVFF